jgi:glutamyl-tRNA reductase
MRVSVVGISHRTAPVAVREHYALDGDELQAVLARLGARYAGAAVLSTCNRTEVYVTDAAVVDDPRPIVALLSEIKGEPPIEGVPFTALTGDEASRHLFRVAAGIESMVVGESEILGQVRGAFTAATRAGTHTPALSRLFHTAIRVGRKVRERTSIGRRPVSVSSMAVDLARREPGDLSEKTVLVIGAGEAGQLSASNLLGAGVARMIVTSRSAERTSDIAGALRARPVAFAQRGRALAEADIAISSTAAHDHVLDRVMVAEAMAARPDRPLLLIDIAVPRDIDPAVRALPNVRLYDIDELQAAGERNLELRRGELVAAEAVIEEDVAKYAEWLRSLAVVPTIAALRERADALRLAELERTLSRMDLAPAARARVEAMSAALVKKLLHAPIARLKDPAGGERYTAAARALFALDDDLDNLAGGHGGGDVDDLEADE